jgi:hypothetical protein
MTAPAITVPSVQAAPLVVLPQSPSARTQVSFVPPMPDNDAPIAPPTAQIHSDPARAGSPPDVEPNRFPRAETPLAPPPSPIIQPRSRRSPESHVPPSPPRENPSPRAPLRAAVPMPERSGRPSSGPIHRPQPAQNTARNVSPVSPPRPTISMSVPPPPFAPAIPAIPAIPAPSRPGDNETTDAQAQISDDGDLDHPTVARVPIEIIENTSKTHVSPGMPMPDDLDAAGHAQDPGYAARSDLESRLRDTSPSATPVVSDAGFFAAPTDSEGEAVTFQAHERISRPAGFPAPSIHAGPPAPPSTPLVAPLVRDRSMLPLSTAPESLPPPRDGKRTSGPTPACPQCESPMAWVEEHLRFYCKSCRMYF